MEVMENGNRLRLIGLGKSKTDRTKRMNRLRERPTNDVSLMDDGLIVVFDAEL